MTSTLQPSSETPSKPQITSSNTQEYRHRLADISSRACISDTLNTLFQGEKIGSASQVTVEELYISTLLRIETKVSLGAQIVEADNFAAVVCWEPPGALRSLDLEELEVIAKTRPIYASFLRNIQSARSECLGVEKKCWQFTLMARDPLRTSRGAVRAVLEPFLKKAKEERLPVWCVAGNERARDVYAYFGFRVVKVVYSGEERVRTWCMVCNWPVE